MRHLLAEGGIRYGWNSPRGPGVIEPVRARNLLRWTPYNRWLHSLKNEPDYPVAVWALARK